MDYTHDLLCLDRGLAPRLVQGDLKHEADAEAGKRLETLDVQPLNTLCAYPNCIIGGLCPAGSGRTSSRPEGEGPGIGEKVYS